ncbi:MAG: hypothetical protein QOH60_5021 [Mycobacterium sp.]|nr:hypothetical protein [Mycobacterium sp.]
MRLDRPTHVAENNRSSGWMSNFTEEIPGQLAAIINRLGDGEYEYYLIYPLPADAEYDEVVHPTEWLQTAGSAERLTVEIKRLDDDGVHRLYTVGRADAANESNASEAVRRGDVEYAVRPSEVLTAADALTLFQHYYDHHEIPQGWHLREQAEFTDTAMQADAAAQDAGVSADLLDAQPSETAAASGSPSAESQQPVDSGEEAASPEGEQRGKPAE